MENNGIILELEEMRLQMATLQKQLDERLKLDEELLKKNTINKKINSINRYGYFSLIGIPIAIISFCIVQYRFHISFEFILIAIITGLIITGLEFWSANRVKSIDISKKSVKEIISTLISMKKNNQRIRLADLLTTAIIIPWLIYELYVHSFSYFMFDEGFPTCLFICVNSTIFFSCLTVILIFSSRIFKKHQRNITEMIEMLKEQE